MSIVAFVSVYCLSLFPSVWYLANCLSLIDEPLKSKPLIRLVASTCVVMIVLIHSQRSWWLPIICAFVTVLLLHLMTPIFAKRFWFGVPRYEDQPLSNATEEEVKAPQ